MHKPAAAAVLLLLSGAILPGCTMGPDFKLPGWAAIPEAWRGAPPKPPASVPVAAPIDLAWWDVFHDAELSALEARVAQENLDVQVATFRLAESRAQRGIVAADAYPTLDGNASYQRTKASNNGIFGGLGTIAAGGGGAGATVGGVNGANIGAVDVYQYGFDASWEVDLWGRVRRAVEASDANVTANEDARRDILLTSLAEVARDYLQLRGTQTRLQIARDNLKTAQQSQELTRERAEGGVTTDLDVANATAQVATFAAQIPALEQQEQQLVNALSLLLGAPPQALQAELAAAQAVPPVPPQVPVGLPSELAERRPDIRQAAAQLHAATATIGVAEANFYPSFTLSANAGMQTLQPKSLFNLSSGFYGVGPSIDIPIFEGGRLKATLALRQDQQKEAAVVYQRTVLNAWHEIDNGLIAYDAEQRRNVQLAQAVAQNERAVALAQTRYQQGVADFLQVLDAQRSLFVTQQSLADSTTTIDTDLVVIYKALGGGWETSFPVPRTVAAK
jgi:NodT family efflux transporter outer membrane factor (OMF) lipoprotein